MSELDKLEAYLKEHGYVYQRTDDSNRVVPQSQIVAYDKKERWMWGAVCHYGSYGFLLEVMGKPVVSDGDSVVRYLTAQDVIDRLEERDG